MYESSSHWIESRILMGKPSAISAVKLMNALANDDLGGVLGRVLDPMDIRHLDAPMASLRAATCPSDKPDTSGPYPERTFLYSSCAYRLDLTSVVAGLSARRGGMSLTAEI